VELEIEEQMYFSNLPVVWKKNKKGGFYMMHQKNQDSELIPYKRFPVLDVFSDLVVSFDGCGNILEIDDENF